MVKNLSTITNTVYKMIENVNSVLNTLVDDDYLRNLSIGITPDSLSTDNGNVGGSAYNKVFSVYNRIPDNFFDMGEEYAANFSNGFLSEISTLTDKLGTVPIQSVYGTGNSTNKNVTYNSSYNFYSSGLTVSQQLQQARQEEILKQLRA